MHSAKIEHANITVKDPAATAKFLGDIFGWRVRWEGPALAGGRTIHVGNDEDYLAVYSPPELSGQTKHRYDSAGGLNHIGIVVSDLEAVEARVKQAGFDPFNHADYEPGRRFYFRDSDGIEFEVISYA